MRTAILCFISVYFMVDLAAKKAGMMGLPRDQLPKLAKLIRQVYLFLPIVVLIYVLFAGYSVIRCGTLAMITAAVVSWLTPHPMGPRQLFQAPDNGARMVLQLVAVCATTGIIVGVIALTGIGSRFSTVLLTLADQSHILALFFAMIVSIILGMGMPTTAAYAVAASVIAPGVINLGVAPLTAHLFIFYFAVMSAITPPVALAAYAGSALARSDPIRTSVESFRIGLACSHVLCRGGSSAALTGGCAARLLWRADHDRGRLGDRRRWARHRAIHALRAKANCSIS